jgi:L-iditol 2-dehydrogenase
VECILPLPAGVGFVEGTLFEPLAVVLLSMTHVAIQPLETAAVFGAGPIGLLTVIMLKMFGAGRVWVVEPVPHRRQMAMVAGADAAVDPHRVDAAGQILRDTANRGVDATIDCATRENSVNQCMRATRRGGRLVVTGVPVELEVPVEIHTARRKGLSIYNTRRSNHTSQLALQLLREHPGRFLPLLTHTLPLEKIQSAFNLLENYTDGAGKVVISLTQPT